MRSPSLFAVFFWLLLLAVSTFDLNRVAYADGDAIEIGDKEGENAEGEPEEGTENPDENKAPPEEGKYTRRGFVRMVVPNGRITGNTTDKLYHIEGGIEIYYFNMMMKGDTADVDQNKETAVLNGNAFVEDPEYRINCDNIEVAYNENWLKATGFVQFERYNTGIANVKEGVDKKTRMITAFKNEKTKVYCSELEYNWETEFFSASGEVKVVQEDTVIEASQMYYDSKAGEYVLTGDVLFTAESYGWLFDSGVVEKEDEKTAKALTKKKTTISCDEMRVNETSGKMTCTMTKETETAPEEGAAETGKVAADEEVKTEQPESESETSEPVPAETETDAENNTTPKPDDADESADDETKSESKKTNKNKQVIVDQGDKKLECDIFEVDDSAKLIRAQGNVKYYQENGNWLIEGGLVKPEEAEKEVTDELGNPMTVTTDTMTFDCDKRKLSSEAETIHIDGSKGKYAECSSLSYDDKEKVLEMGGGVVISSGKEYLYCESLKADTDNKVYEFFGDVDGFFKYQKRDEADKPVEETGTEAGVEGEGTGTGGEGGDTVPPIIEPLPKEE